jgi:hypothetical protein
MSEPTVFTKESTCEKCVVLLKDFGGYVLLDLVVSHFDVAYTFWTPGFRPIALFELRRDPSGLASGTSLWGMLTTSQTWQLSDGGVITAYGTFASHHRNHLLSQGCSIDVVFSSRKFGQEIWVEHIW